MSQPYGDEQVVRKFVVDSNHLLKRFSKLANIVESSEEKIRLLEEKVEWFLNMEKLLMLCNLISDIEKLSINVDQKKSTLALNISLTIDQYQQIGRYYVENKIDDIIFALARDATYEAYDFERIKSFLEVMSTYIDVEVQRKAVTKRLDVFTNLNSFSFNVKETLLYMRKLFFSKQNVPDDNREIPLFNLILKNNR
jgi:hypothetical protein